MTVNDMKMQLAPGPRFSIPEGETVVSRVRYGMSFKDAPPDQQAAFIKMGTESYRFIRKLLILQDQSKLSPEDAVILDQALNMINELRQIRGEPSKIAIPLINKYWAAKSTNGSTLAGKKQEAKLSQRLERTLFLIRETCTNNDVPLPQYLSGQEYQDAMTILIESINNLADLMQRLHRRKTDGK